MPWLAPPGKTLVTADIGCQTEDPMWTMAEDKLVELCLEHLTPIIRDVKDRFLGVQVLRTPIAYPVFLNDYEEERRQLETVDRRRRPLQRRPQRRVRPHSHGGRVLADAGQGA